MRLNNMLVFAGFTPSSPLLLPSINTNKLAQVRATLVALEELSAELYAAHPDTLVILSESQIMYKEAFSLNLADPYLAELIECGDLGYKKLYHPDFALIDSLQRYCRKLELPVSLSTDANLNVSTVVALELLTAHLPHLRIVPIAPCDLEAKAHFNFGIALKHLLLESDQRIAVIAAGDMSHSLSKSSPAGYHKDGRTFDQTILAMLKEHNASGLLQIPITLIKHAEETSYRQLCLLTGVLDGMYTAPNILSYEAPFGVGYCVANFVL